MLLWILNLFLGKSGIVYIDQWSTFDQERGFNFAFLFRARFHIFLLNFVSSRMFNLLNDVIQKYYFKKVYMKFQNGFHGSVVNVGFHFHSVLPIEILFQWFSIWFQFPIIFKYVIMDCKSVPWKNQVLFISIHDALLTKYGFSILLYSISYNIPCFYFISFLLNFVSRIFYLLNDVIKEYQLMKFQNGFRGSVVQVDFVFIHY